MSSYQSFTSNRATEIDAASLSALLRAADATVGVQHDEGSAAYILKKATPWSAGDIAFAQTVLDTAPARSPQLAARTTIVNWPIETRALVLALLDQINVLRAKLPIPLPPITAAQALTAVADKAGTLT